MTMATGYDSSYEFEPYVSLFEYLPDEILHIIFGMCDMQSLGRLAKTCRRFRRIISYEDRLWRVHSLDVLGSNMSVPAMEERCKPILKYMERCKLGKKWTQELGMPVKIQLYPLCLPWIVLERDHLFFAKGKILVKISRAMDGDCHLSPYRKTSPFVKGAADITKFAVNETEVICCGSDGQLVRVEKGSLRTVHSKQGHYSEIFMVAAKKDIIVSGSRDQLAKIWKMYPNKTKIQKEIYLNNYVLSTAIMPSMDKFILGTPGTRSIHPLQMFDLETATHMTNLGYEFRHGAGILDIFPESDSSLLSCGYDTSVKLWDIRSPKFCVQTYEDPFDSGLYCVQSDYNVTIITGKATEGSFLVWDKRKPRIPVHCYYVPYHREGSSFLTYLRGPVYSVAFDAAHIYAAFQRSLIQFSFSCCLKSKRGPCDHRVLELPYYL